MRAPIRKLGSSSGVIIPKPILSQIGVEAGDDLDLSLDENRNCARASQTESARRVGGRREAPC